MSCWQGGRLGRQSREGSRPCSSRRCFLAWCKRREEPRRAARGPILGTCCLQSRLLRPAGGQKRACLGRWSRMCMPKMLEERRRHHRCSSRSSGCCSCLALWGGAWPSGAGGASFWGHFHCRGCRSRLLRRALVGGRATGSVFVLSLPTVPFCLARPRGTRTPLGCEERHHCVEGVAAGHRSKRMRWAQDCSCAWRKGSWADEQTPALLQPVHSAQWHRAIQACTQTQAGKENPQATVRDQEKSTGSSPAPRESHRQAAVCRCYTLPVSTSR